MAKLVVDANGVVTEGRFAGRNVDEVMTYLEGLEEAVTNPNSAPPEKPTEQAKPEPTAAEKMVAAAKERIDPIQQMTLTRLEQDDEQEFRKLVPDYDKYREQIEAIKKTLHPAHRAQRGVHRTLYINVKSNDPKVANRVFEKIEDEVPPVDGEEDGEVPPVPSPARVEPPIAERQPAARAVPKAAPPMAKPTPASRQSAAKQGEVKSKLIPTDKIKQICRSQGIDVDVYMLRLERSGMTQEQIDTAGQLGRRQDNSGRVHAYDRKFAKRG